MADAVARRVFRRGRIKGATRKELLAAGVTGLVETGFENLSGGDRDSAGWRQERRKYYRNPTNIDAAADRFFDEIRAFRGKGMSVGELAQATQQSAFPGRYQPRLAEARQLLARLGGGSVRDGIIESVSRRVPEIHLEGARQALADALRSGSKNPLLEGQRLLATGAYGTTLPSRTITTRSEGTAKGGSVAAMVQRANIISRAAPPYKWGGGHGRRPAALGVPVDCSGAVSQVLGINPRVSGAFGSVGKPGPGPSRGVRVYYNGGHVLMEINGRFFGTSGSNPGGGAGWIPRSKISKSYLRGFKVRHL